MEWWVWVIIAAFIVIFFADWLIVMGTKPKEWHSSKYNKRR